MTNDGAIKVWALPRDPRPLFECRLTLYDVMRKL